jgi:hypothetical protein
MATTHPKRWLDAGGPASRQRKTGAARHLALSALGIPSCPRSQLAAVVDAVGVGSFRRILTKSRVSTRGLR